MKLKQHDFRYHSLPPRKKLVEIMETRMAALKPDYPLRPIFESEIEFMNTDSVKLVSSCISYFFELFSNLFLLEGR